LERIYQVYSSKISSMAKKGELLMNKLMQRSDRSSRASMGALAFVVLGLVGFFLLSSSSGVWATPEQSPLRQTIPPPGSIAGKVCHPTIANLCYPGVTVNLYSDPPSETTTTDANGAYIFTTVAPGAHTVELVTPEGFCNASSNPVSAFIPEGGSSTVDFFIQSEGTVSGKVFNDLDGDGHQGTGEGGIGGVTIELKIMAGTVVDSTVTAGDGSYVFSGVTVEPHNVVETDPAGYVSTTPNTLSISMSPCGCATASFGDQAVNTVSGRVFEDLDGDGIQGPSGLDGIAGERGMGGVTVSLLDAYETVVASTTTADNGSYLFTAVIAGDYSVAETDPLGYGSTTPNVVPISLGPGESATVNFGDQAVSTVSGRVFNDLDGDGQPDRGEGGMQGVMMTLTSTLMETTTDFTGVYVFTDVPDGSHVVAAAPPVGYACTSPTEVVVDVRPGSGATANYGLKAAGTVSGIVFNDLDGDGTQDVGEPGLGGVSIQLKDSGGSLADSVVTTGDGTYTFTGVAAGSYTVQETDPEGFVSITPNEVPISVAPDGAATANFGDRVPVRIRLLLVMKNWPSFP
jgi:hypothetical protein